MTSQSPIDGSDILLTAPSGELGRHCSASARNLIAIFSSGRSYMVQGADDHHEVVSVLSLARKKGVPLERFPAQIVDPGTIRGLYHHHPHLAPAAASPVVDDDDTQMRDDVYDILQSAIRKRGVSDIFVRYDKEEGRVLALVDGILERLIDHRWEPAYAKQFVRATLSWAGKEGSAERGYMEGSHQVAQITRGLPPGLQSVRLEKLVEGFDGEELNIRLMPTPKGGRIDLGAIGFDAAEKAAFDELIAVASGIVAVTGPTGSGKTTTLHGMVNRSLALFPGDRWVTAEDPIEIRIVDDNVAQVDVVRTATNEDFAASYKRALEAALRSAPKRLLFGEIRSEDTAGIAVRAALTGHPVFTTLHTESCPQVVPRLMDLGISASLLRNQGVLRGISSQRLLRVLCGCRQTIERDQWKGPRPRWLENVFAQNQGAYMPNKEGCSRCRGGYVVGRKVITEIMLLDDKLLDLLVEGRMADAMEHWRSNGGVPLLERARRGIAAGEFDPYEVMRCLNS
jgi:type II secretory ATPase GspE/PulE/Tfp pilus assembly ATPase PilB-like protein